MFEKPIELDEEFAHFKRFLDDMDSGDPDQFKESRGIRHEASERRDSNLKSSGRPPTHDAPVGGAKPGTETQSTNFPGSSDATPRTPKSARAKKSRDEAPSSSDGSRKSVRFVNLARYEDPDDSNLPDLPETPQGRQSQHDMHKDSKSPSVGEGVQSADVVSPHTANSSRDADDVSSLNISKSGGEELSWPSSVDGEVFAHFNVLDDEGSLVSDVAVRSWVPSLWTGTYPKFPVASFLAATHGGSSSSASGAVAAPVVATEGAEEELSPRLPQDPATLPLRVSFWKQKDRDFFVVDYGKVPILCRDGVYRQQVHYQTTRPNLVYRSTPQVEYEDA